LSIMHAMILLKLSQSFVLTLKLPLNYKNVIMSKQVMDIVMEPMNLETNVLLLLHIVIDTAKIHQKLLSNSILSLESILIAL